MAVQDIATYLATILSATYGEQVRQAIHDAIQSCYEDGKSGATDLTARQLYHTLETALGNVTSQYNMVKDETVLFEGEAYGTGAIINLNLGEGGALTDFDRLDFYTNASGNSEIRSIPATNTTYSLREVNLSDDATQYFIGANELNMSIDNSTITITSHVNFALYRSGGVIGMDLNYVNPSQTENVGFKILKIVGRKNAQNLEVVDIRTGADGVIYSSAGDAVRTQIANLPDVGASIVGDTLIISTVANQDDGEDPEVVE